MKNGYTKFGKYFFGGLSIILLAYVVYSIGLENIYDVWTSADVSMLFIALSLAVVATIIRIGKFFILLRAKSFRDTLDIFTTSRIGKEVSFAGYFLPLAKKSHRAGGTFHQLVIDRYSEILATIFLAFLASIFLFNRGHVELTIFIVLACIFLALLLLPFVGVPFGNWLKKKAFTHRVLDTIQNLQQKLRVTSSTNVLTIHLLSILATMLDFISSYYIFEAYGVTMNILYIAAIWASSAFIAMLAFMIIGSTEISVIYLFSVLTHVTKAVVASTIIVSRLINVVVLIILFIFVLLQGKKTISYSKMNEPAS